MNDLNNKNLKGKIKFENKAIIKNMIGNSKQSQLLVDYFNQGNNLNKSESHKWFGLTELELKPYKPKETDYLNKHIEEYFESKQSSRELKRINNSVYRGNGFHKLLQLYLLSNDMDEKKDNDNVCRIIKSIFYNTNSFKEKDVKDQSERKKWQMSNSMGNLKLSLHELRSGNTSTKKLTQNTNAFKSIINNNCNSTICNKIKINLNTKHPKKTDFQNRFDHKGNK